MSINRILLQENVIGRLNIIDNNQQSAIYNMIKLFIKIQLITNQLGNHEGRFTLPLMLLFVFLLGIIFEVTNNLCRIQMKDVIKIIQQNNTMYLMIRNNERTETQLISGMGLLKKKHLTSSDIVSSVIYFLCC